MFFSLVLLILLNFLLNKNKCQISTDLQNAYIKKNSRVFKQKMIFLLTWRQLYMPLFKQLL